VDILGATRSERAIQRATNLTGAGASPDDADKTVVLGELAAGEAKEVADACSRPMEVYEATVAQVAGHVPSAVEKAIAKTGKR
jgi:hypothetical protein